jgi:hypothetical protein
MAAAPAWPIAYDDIEPCYTAAEPPYQVQAEALTSSGVDAHSWGR